MKKTIKILLMLLIIFCALGGLKSFATETLGTEEVQWTDFSKAKFEIISDTCQRFLKVKNVTKKENSLYSCYITSSNSKPSIEDVKQTLFIDGTTNITQDVALNQEMYLWVVESIWDLQNGNQTNFVVEGVKLEEPELPKYGDAFTLTDVSNTGAQILMNIPWDVNNGIKREMTIKVGKVTDNSILKKIKNNENKGWDELLKYSKNSKFIYNKTVMSNTYGYKVDKSLLDISDIQDKAYYYLYVEVDDEDGKYDYFETVTLAQAITYKEIGNDYFLFFISDDSFEWNIEEEEKEEVIEEEVEEEEEEEDDTTVDGDIPYTGIDTKVIAIIAVVAIIGTIAYIKNRDLRGIE